MKRLKTGPELKMPDLKVPPVLRDLFNDLRDRRLLPLLALVIVAIVAVPFLLGESPEDEEAAPLQRLAPSQGQTAEQTALRVVEATPPLRDYRKRLRARVATNPFKQKYTAPVLKGAKLQSESSTSSGSESSSTSTTTEPSGDGGAGPIVTVPPSSSPPGAGGGGAGGGENGSGGGVNPPDLDNNPDLRFYTWKIKVQISRTETADDGTVKMGEPEVREHVKSLSPLPGEKAPVVTFIGINPSTGMAVLQVSREVSAVFGDAKCISGTGTCELLEVEKGFPETFEYGPNQVRYKFKVIDIELVRVAKP